MPSAESSSIAALLSAPSELTNSSSSKTAIVLMTRVRLARNLAGHSFPGWARPAEREQLLAACRAAVAATPPMRRGFNFAITELGELERQVLVERHLISRELSGAKGGAGVVISRDQAISVMVNEEDHLRAQVLRSGFNLKKAWTIIDELDSTLEEHLDYAFSPNLGYLTACPTNLGTAMRASVMMHLPALVIANQMEKVVRAVNQLGMVVRGLFGEGSDASGSIFQISNQTTLGKSEEEIISEFKHLIIPKLVEYEKRARQSLQRERSVALDDKIWRAYGLLIHARTVSTEEALFLLSHVRMGVSLGRIDSLKLETLNDLFLMIQPAHLQKLAGKKLSGEERSISRADLIRKRLTGVSTN